MITFPKQLVSTGGLIGRPISRVDGRDKVMGAATYAAEFPAVGLRYGVIVSSTIAKGRIKSLDTSAALSAPGVIHVFYHEDRPNLAWFDRSYRDMDSPAGSPMRPLYDAEIHYSGQPIALVVAQTFEQARHAARLLIVSYEEEPHQTNLHVKRAEAREPSSWGIGKSKPPKAVGDAAKTLIESAVQVDAEYSGPAEYHNPMEMHASTVVYEADAGLTVYDKTQGVQNVQAYISKVFGLSKKKVRVVSPFVGGAFGSGLRPAYQLFLAVMAAQSLKCSVRVSMTRQQMFTFGHRPETIQRLALGADAEGKLQALIHEVVGETSEFEDYVESVSNWSGLLYPSPNTSFDHKIVPLNVHTPLDMRAPGAAWGCFASECAMDEVAAKAGIDPLTLRLINYAEKDPIADKPFGSKELRACYSQAAERFGWQKRTAEPRSMREGNKLIGWGMATGVWDAMHMFSGAKAVLDVEGKLVVSVATSDIGTGTYTIMTQIAAETLGLPLEDVTFKLGDSSFPMSLLEGGSWTAASVGSAVKGVCDHIAEKLFKLARKMENSPLAGVKFKDIEVVDGGLQVKGDGAKRAGFKDIMVSAGLTVLEKKVMAMPSPSRMKYAHYAHSAIFVEVKVDEDFGTIQVTRVVSAVAGGRILNPKTARSQILGGIVWGIGMALHEEALMDHSLGRIMNHSFAEYHIPVNADVHDIEVIFVEEHDEHVNPLGVKGLGEIGLVGVAAAIANAVYHATGKRVRDLPLTLDKLL